jgi:hypothetical protein
MNSQNNKHSNYKEFQKEMFRERSLQLEDELYQTYTTVSIHI